MTSCGFFARQIGNLQILIVATYRTDELHRKHVLYTFLPFLVREIIAIRLSCDRSTAGGQRALIRQHYSLERMIRHGLNTFLPSMRRQSPVLRNSCAHWKTRRVLAQLGERWSLGDLEQAALPACSSQVIERRSIQAERRDETNYAGRCGHRAGCAV